jgi:Bacterial Ig-like domain/L,D-transpeptidase catalytic domain
LFGVGRPDKQPADDGSQGSAEPGETAGDSDKATGGRMFGLSPKVLGLGAVAAAVALTGGAFALISSTSGHPRGADGQPAGQPASGPIRIVSVSPADGASQVNGAGPITVTFSGPVAADTPQPTLQPAIPGHWSALGDQLVFTPAAGFKPSSKVTLTVPSGLDGVHGAGGGLLGKTVTEHFRTGRYASLRLTEILGQLGYLPLNWAVATSGAFKEQFSSYGSDLPSVTQESMAYDPPAGSFTWRPGYPAELRSLWSPDSAGNVVVRGAIMAFQSQHGMTINGDVTQRLWNALFRAASAAQPNQNGYTYAIASKSLPETLTIWHNGHIVLRSLANTGIPVSPTVDGSFPVYQRYRFQIMSGTNPDGSHYADPVSFVSYFNGGDAVHYFPRGSYGFQQSLGCVELPMTSAKAAYPYRTYGSVVTVRG